MKRPGLIPQLASATLFLVLAGRMPAQSDMMSAMPKSAATAGASAEKAKPSKPAGKSRTEAAARNFDLDGDGMLDDAERAAAKRALMQEIDSDAGGDPAAASTAWGNRGNTADSLKGRMVAMFDQNKNGRLDDDERAAAQRFAAERGLGAGGAEMRAELMKRFDENQNGRLDPEERAAVQEFLGGRAEASKKKAKADAKE